MPRPAWPPAQSFFPQRATHASFARAVQTCKACDLYKRATRAVFGEGATNALVMFVGEQPGDQEDIAGRPFVGPAGKFLRKALTEVGIPENRVLLTNAVKHFNWSEIRGGRRVHKPPNLAQINACRPWLEAEIRLVQPRMIVCLGATAARSVLGPTFRITRQRGEVLKNAYAGWIIGTYHPSAIVRMPDPEKRAEARLAFLSDLRKVAAQAKKIT